MSAKTAQLRARLKEAQGFLESVGKGSRSSTALMIRAEIKTIRRDLAEEEAALILADKHPHVTFKAIAEFLGLDPERVNTPKKLVPHINLYLECHQ